MSRETWTIVQNKEVWGIELQMALQCAPLITGLKISNLLNICKEDFPAMKELVKNSHISWYLLLERDDRMTIFLYDKKGLESYLAQKRVLEMFLEAGYKSFSLESILKELRIRYQRYMENKEDFPHEMGLLLGYPAEDVEGFMKHKGENSLCTGYWKVYKNKDRKLKIFESFENAKETLIQLLHCGITMGDIIAVCCNRMEKSMM
ncbi:MAG: DUF3793 family protein [Roseburia sp.]|nr:DUF3793 family protein [Roseburia sp.]MCM1278514.1 DUF3793 family protein [Robinsoniella sp.]